MRLIYLQVLDFHRGHVINSVIKSGMKKCTKPTDHTMKKLLKRQISHTGFDNDVCSKADS